MHHAIDGEGIFAGTSYLIAHLGPDLRFLRVNDAFARRLGLEAPQLPGRGFSEVFPDSAHAEDLRNTLEKGERFSGQDLDFLGLGPSRLLLCDVECFRRQGETAAAGLVLILVDRTRRALAFRELEESRAQVSRLAAHLQELREEERKGIAREIHDELGGELTALKMDLAVAMAGGDGAAGALASAEETADRSIALVQRIATGLRPRILDDFGLEAAVEWLVADFRRRAQIRCDLSCGLGSAAVGRPQSTALFRIVQEALTNVSRHARATHVRVGLRAEDGAAEAEVTDNGIGISPERSADPDSFGLAGIRERAEHFGGWARIEGRPGQGTRVLVRILLGAERRP